MLSEQVRELLENGSEAMKAVEAAVVSLEDCVLFNAGRGAVFGANGRHEMDASVMCGKTLNAGAVAAVTGLKNPVSLAGCRDEAFEARTITWGRGRRICQVTWS